MALMRPGEPASADVVTSPAPRGEAAGASCGEHITVAGLRRVAENQRAEVLAVPRGVALAATQSALVSGASQQQSKPAPPKAPPPHPLGNSEMLTGR